MTPVSEYPDLIARRSQLRGWDLSTSQIDAFAAELEGNDHAGLFLPTAVTLRLGRGLRYDWIESTLWIQDVLREHKLPFSPEMYIDPSRLSYFPSSEPENEEVELSVALLDFQTFWGRKNGIVPRQARKQRRRWPGTQVSWFLAMNPGYYLGMNGKDLPFLWTPGLVVDSEDLPCFCLLSGEVFVLDLRDDDSWHTRSVVAFREC